MSEKRTSWWTRIKSGAARLIARWNNLPPERQKQLSDQARKMIEKGLK